MNTIRWICAASVIGLVAGGSLADAPASKPKTEVNGAVYGAIENFNWKEYAGGEEVLEENGPLLLLGGFLEIGSKEGVSAKGLVEVYTGTINYDGSTWEGEAVASDTAYDGVKGEGTLGFGLKGGKGLYAKPFIGLGLNTWLRSLDYDDGEQGPRGYDETWTTFYGLFGVAASLEMNAKSSLFGQIALHMPFYNHVAYDFRNIGGDDEIELEPGKEAGLYLEAGLIYTDFRFALFYEQMDFGESNMEWISNDVVVWQPESKARIVGLSAGIAF